MSVNATAIEIMGTVEDGINDQLDNLSGSPSAKEILRSTTNINHKTDLGATATKAVSEVKNINQAAIGTLS
jgi:hypothetical protein